MAGVQPRPPTDVAQTSLIYSVFAGRIRSQVSRCQPWPTLDFVQTPLFFIVRFLLAGNSCGQVIRFLKGWRKYACTCTINACPLQHSLAYSCLVIAFVRLVESPCALPEACPS